jgi:tetratricopeptide (TPR) repeat protein
MTSAERADCPPAEQLACFLDGALAPGELVELETHLGGCDRCCSIIAELAGVAPEGDEPAAFDDRIALGRLGRYVLLERIGAGGMGIVWAAYDTELERRVALKLLRAKPGDAGADARRRLVREARAMARVSHPNVVAVHDVVEEDERVFMTMELVVGRTLGAWLRESPRPWREIVEVFIAAGRGLAAAHTCGVVHRDFKPDNVLIAPRGAQFDVRVGDFGLAHTGIDASSSPSEETPTTIESSSVSAAALVGTPAYMAPEQFVGGAIDARTDQFAFCIAMWEALFGVRPFHGGNVTELAEAIAAGRIGAPGDRRGVPARLEAVLRRGLAREPSSRWPDMHALLDALARTLHPRRKLGWIAASTIAVGTIGALAWPARSPCTATPPWLVSAWNPTVRARIVDAATARGEVAASLAAPLVTAIDEDVAALGESFVRSCRATFDDHVATAEDHDARIACLRRSATAITVLAEFAADTDENGLARALRATDAIGDAADCDELDRIHLDQPWLVGTGDRSRAVELGLALQRAVQLRRLGEFDRARELLVEPLAAEDEPGLAVAAAYELAVVEQRQQGNGSRFHEVLARAAALGNDVVIYDTLGQLVFEAGTREHDLAAAEAYAELALAFVPASQRGDVGRGRVLLSLGQARERAGDLAAAREALLESEAAFVGTGTIDLPPRFPLWIALGLVDELSGDLATAERRYDDARARIEQAYGAFHPDVAVALEYLATVRRKQGEFDEALAAAQRSLAIRSAVLGAQHDETATAYDVIGKIAIDRQRWDEAEVALGSAIAIWRVTGSNDRGAALAEAALAEVQVRKGAVEEGLAHYRAALVLAERTLGAEHPELAYSLLGIGAALLRLDRPDEARAPLERASTLLGSGGESVLRGMVHLDLAKAIVRAGGDRERGRALIEAARDDASKGVQSLEVERLQGELDAAVVELGF